ncbi:MAG TPA: kelch repeat-containing protein, partial [Nitrospira sp.]|nr:kelch repeat-containing protein [Nitrospira sp.]
LYAQVSGTVFTDVTWGVLEANGGSITPAGVYTAPATSGEFQVVATSVADPSKSFTGPVSVGAYGVQVTPISVVVSKGGTQQFTARVSGCATNYAVTWAVEEGVSGGTIASDGTYTAPAVAGGPYHVVATSVDNPSVTGSATVQVAPGGFYSTGGMSVRRGFHTATRLLNGEVLVAGGVYVCSAYEGDDECSERPVWSTAELFDPATGQFRSTGAMSTPRWHHAAVLLTDGRVLVVGGQDQDTGIMYGPSLSTAELYDPATGTFSPTGSMAKARNSATATLLPDGRVLVSGGWDEECRCASDSAEIYDPATGSFLQAGPMLYRRVHHTASLLADGRVLLVGGSDGVSSELFDPAMNKFEFAANMDLDRDSHAATVLEDGRVLVSGGQRSRSESWTEAEIFDPALERFTVVGSMNVPRAFHTATLLTNGQILVTGRQIDLDRPDLSSSAELFDPASQTFTSISGMRRARGYGHAATLLLDGSVLITGGALDNSAELYK